MGQFDVSDICIFQSSVLSPFALHIGQDRVIGIVLFVLFVIQMSTPSLVVFVGNWQRKRSVWMHNEHMELRSEVGNQVEQDKTGKHELKSQINTKRSRAGRVSVVCRLVAGRQELFVGHHASGGTTRVWCRTARSSSGLQRENAHWCQTVRMLWWTARATRLGDYFLYLAFYLFLELYYFFLDRFLHFPIYRTLGHWGWVSFCFSLWFLGSLLVDCYFGG